MFEPLTEPTSWLLALLVLAICVLYVLRLRRRIEQLDEHGRQLQRTVEKRSQQLEKANKALREMANGDPLTGIANHRSFQDNLRAQWRRTARSRLPLTLLMIDVDGLKHYNESRGHQAGDECLREIAQVIRTKLQRPGDLLARYGGDEFSVLLAETDAAGGLAVAERVRQAIEEMELVLGPETSGRKLTVSVGVATIVPSPQEHPTSLIAAADRALSVAKRSGRNRVEM
jgi:diguanylate cyclase (GGDEF)-like protein